jgi:hypothetical protein
MKYSFLSGIFLIFNGLLSAQQVLPGKCSAALQREFSSLPDSSLVQLAVADLPGFQSWAEGQGFESVQVYRPAKVIVLHASQKDFLEKILPNPAVLFADRGDATPREELPVPGHNLFLNKISLALTEFPGLNGSGTTVSVKENRFDTADVDLKNRATTAPNAAQQNTSHANITATLIGGAGNADLAGQGAAWGAQLVSHGFNNLLPDEDYAEKNISVQNHSYGVDIENYYGTGAFAYDVSTAENPSLLHVFSAGNKGLETSNSGGYANIPGLANLTGNFKMAKNVLTVGMVDSFSQSLAFSSRGPAYDGRVKPDLTAYGAGGTSESAALVSGAAAVIQQALREQTGDWPDAALVRAILLNSADDIGSPGPDFATGFGNLNLQKSLETVENQNFATKEIGGGEAISFFLNLPPNAAQLKVTLTWNDPPAALNAPKALVNGLDLKVVSPSGSAFLPWVLSHFPHPDSLCLPAARRRDTLNNVEQITLDFPAAGQYEVQVFGSKVQTSAQVFSVAWHWEIEDEFAWHYPQKNALVVAAREVLLSWENTFADSTGRLEIRYAGEQNWQEIAPETDLHKGWTRWLVPDVFAEAQLRVQVGNQFFESDTFLIAKQLRMDVGFNCPDSVGLFWNAAAPGAEYLLSGLGERYLEPLFTTSDTFVVLQKAEFPQKRFSVAPLGPSGKRGARSPAPDISQQGVGCYFENFLATLNDDSQADLSLSIGTRYGVGSVVFEKMKNGAFEALKTWQPVETETFVFTDEFPQKGVNRYRARLNLLSGATLYSDTAEVYLIEEGEVLLFPNPVAAQGVLNIVSNISNDAVFAVFDVCGKLVLEEKLDDVRVEIVLPSLPHGIYFWQLRQEGKDGDGGKLVLSF